MNTSGRYHPIRIPDPPIQVKVRLPFLFPPRRLRWATATPGWQRGAGLQLAEICPGQILALVVTSTGDLLLELRLRVTVAQRRRWITVLVPASDAITPATAIDTARLQALARELDVRW